MEFRDPLPRLVGFVGCVLMAAGVMGGLAALAYRELGLPQQEIVATAHRPVALPLAAPAAAQPAAQDRLVVELEPVNVVGHRNALAGDRTLVAARVIGGAARKASPDLATSGP